MQVLTYPSEISLNYRRNNMIIFEKKNELTNVQMVVTNDGLTWMELSDEFVNFLQACGYIVQGYEVGDHLCTQYAFQKEEKNAIREQLEDEIDLASYQERKNEEEVNLSPKRKRRKKNARTLQKR